MKWGYHSLPNNMQMTLTFHELVQETNVLSKIKRNENTCLNMHAPLEV